MIRVANVEELAQIAPISGETAIVGNGVIQSIYIYLSGRWQFRGHLWPNMTP